MKIGACYIRVSTSEQTEYSPESQLRLIKDYAAKNGILLLDEYVYRDEGISGRTAEKRPSFQKMITAAKQKKFEIILIYSTSRFARNHEQSIVYRSMLERDCNIEVVSITQPSVDKKTDMLTTAIYSVMDEWYSLDLADNVRRGMTEKALQGGYQTLPPFGYEQKHKKEIMTINEEEAVSVRYIFEQFLNNRSKWAISRDLRENGVKTKQGNYISTRNLAYILRNPVYKGYSRWTPTKRIYWDFKNEDTIIARGKHEPIIDEQIFEEVQKKLDISEEIVKAKARPQESMKHWLSGLLKCSNCGQTLTYNGSTPKRKYPCFRCGGYGKGICTTMNFITVAEAEKNILDYLALISKDINILYRVNIDRQNDNAIQIGRLNDGLKKLNGKLERAKQGFLNGIFDIDEYKKIKASCDIEIDTISKSLSLLGNDNFSGLPLQKDIINVYRILIGDSFDKNDRQIALRCIIKKIVFDKKHREFRVYFYN